MPAAGQPVQGHVGGGYTGVSCDSRGHNSLNSAVVHTLLALLVGCPSKRAQLRLWGKGGRWVKGGSFVEPAYRVQ